ncbi:MAG: DHH family phosphoesterase [Lachnospiraceae bacterium]|nr:DHH family phosphoesterase [Lachnospiraceae bacterium]
MHLSELDHFENITIQCHDNPDPDALASAYGLFKFYSRKGCEVRIIYSGSKKITKSNLLLMIKEIGIPVSYHPAGSEKIKGLLITVDCQYGQGNVTKLEADEYAVIDHHNGTSNIPRSIIRPELGSCSTLVWSLMTDEGYDVISDRALCTSFYYGLMTDTGNFSEISHPLDKDMRDNLIFDESLIRLFTNSNLSLDEMRITGEALAGYACISSYSCGILEADDCDPNILGIISDMALQVDGFNVVIAFGHVSGGFKLSVRSCIKEVMADEFTRFITSGIGSGGGHDYKAGGFISEDRLSENHPGLSIRDYLDRSIRSYFESFSIIRSSEYKPDRERFDKYTKNRIVLGYIDPTSFLDKNTRIKIRTLEGDTELMVNEDFFIMVGILGEVYPISRDKFKAGYDSTDLPFSRQLEYVPKIYTEPDGKMYDLTDRIIPCISTGNSCIYAAKLDKNVKLFSEWYKERYMAGKAGDYIAFREDDPNDFYIIREDIFSITYSAVND